MIEKLSEMGVSSSLLSKVRDFALRFDTDEYAQSRLIEPRYVYHGKEVWEMAISALLNGENLLLCGPKATGKNILAENLAAVFARPQWTVSFHGLTDSASVIGTDTFKAGEVSFRKGSITECAEYGGFAILDEINMARNDALAILYSVLDYRRMIDISGYQKIDLHEACRFIGTMNYAYTGTKELSDALVSRFMVIDMPPLDSNLLETLILSDFSRISDKDLGIAKSVFFDLKTKAEHGEISGKSIDVRGLLSAIRAISIGLSPKLAFDMALKSKVFDEYEKAIVADAISLSVPDDLKAEDFFGQA